MNITLSVDERVADEARKAASAMGKSLNQAVRDYLEQLARAHQLQAQLSAFEASALGTPGRLNGWQFDTNLLVYADAADEPAKQLRAIDLIKTHRANGEAVLSTQVLQEYVNVALRKLHLPVPLVRERLSLYARFDLVPATPDLIENALALHVLHGLSFYDSLIVQAAIASGCSVLLTEDLQHGASIGGVKIVNPFVAGI
jgi:predicted nucleic acid-binding protein